MYLYIVLKVQYLTTIGSVRFIKNIHVYINKYNRVKSGLLFHLFLENVNLFL